MLSCHRQAIPLYTLLKDWLSSWLIVQLVCCFSDLLLLLLLVVVVSIFQIDRCNIVRFKVCIVFFALVYELVLRAGCSAFQCSAGCEMLLFFLSPLCWFFIVVIFASVRGVLSAEWVAHLLFCATAGKCGTGPPYFSTTSKAPLIVLLAFWYFKVFQHHPQNPLSLYQLHSQVPIKTH